MGRYIICKDPSIQIDLIVREDLLPQLVSYIQRTGCTYAKEKPMNLHGPHELDGTAVRHVCLKDVQSTKGVDLGELIGLFYSLEWGNLVEGREDKFYVMIKKRKGIKHHVHKNRAETNSGSESGDRGEPAVNSGSGPVDEPDRDGSDTGSAGTDNPGIVQE